MLEWLEVMFDGWEYDREVLGLGMSSDPDSLETVWNAGVHAPLLAWLAARACRNHQERQAVLSAAIECARRSIQRTTASHFDESATSTSFESVASFALGHAPEPLPNLGRLLRAIARVFENLENLRLLMEGMKKYVAPTALPEDFEGLSPIHQQAWKQKLSNGENGAYHRRFPNEVSALVRNAERLDIRCHLFENPDSPMATCYLDDALKEFLVLDLTENRIRPKIMA